MGVWVVFEAEALEVLLVIKTAFNLCKSIVYVFQSEFYLRAVRNAKGYERQ